LFGYAQKTVALAGGEVPSGVWSCMPVRGAGEGGLTLPCPAPFKGLAQTGLAAAFLAPFCSRKINCQQCSTRRRSDGGTEYFHAFLGASLVAPGHKQVLPLPPAFIAPQDGAEKQDCERNAAKRWLAKHGASFAHLRPVYLGDDLFACQPIAAAIHQAGGNFILTCKLSSHKTNAEYLHGAELQEHRQTVCKRGKPWSAPWPFCGVLP
jgi:hypothetical protein